MIASLFPLVKPFLRALDPETAHQVTLQALKLLPPTPPPMDDPRLAMSAFGLRFPNPVGLAAGFDKQCEVPDQLLAQGFGFLELGGVVPRPQPGNPRPRVFRLTRDEAVINRFGLNSDGVDVARERLNRRADRPGIVGVNIGANKDSADRVADYALCIAELTGLVDFLTVNVSSPNTPGLRDLQGEAFLDEILATSIAARDEAAGRSAKRTAILLKIAPDIALDALDAIIACALRRGVDALIVANTTISRPESLVEKELAREAGGLSGRPLFEPSTRLLAHAALRLEGRLPLIGVGGVDSAEAAWAKIRAGATLIQLYTALIYKGPGLVEEIKSGLLRAIESVALPDLASAVGRDTAAIAHGRF